MNPFKYGKEVTGYQFYDRRKCSKDLYQTLVHSSIRGLLQKGAIDSVKGVYRVADPFFARYLQMRYNMRK